MSCSFLEVYNEQITDLLLPSHGRAAWGSGGSDAAASALSLRSDGHSGDVVVHGLSEVPVHQAHQAMSLVRRALRNRAVRQTDMNARSSRSHAVLQLVLEQAPSATANGAPLRAQRARLNLVDLAGSERVQNVEGGGLGHAHQRELAHINKSLSALANCIAALAQEGRTHVPYRDSVLTRLLQASLGGNSRTCSSRPCRRRTGSSMSRCRRCASRTARST